MAGKRRKAGAGALERMAGQLVGEGAAALADLALGFVVQGVARDVARLKGRAQGRRSAGRPAAVTSSRCSSSPKSDEAVELVEVGGVWMPIEEARRRSRTPG